MTRHTYATVSLDAGINPKIISERIGHASLAFTLQVYTHRSEGRDRAAVETIAALFVPKPPEDKDQGDDDSGTDAEQEEQ